MLPVVLSMPASTDRVIVREAISTLSPEKMAQWASLILMFLLQVCARELMRQKFILQTSIRSFQSTIRVLKDLEIIDKQLNSSINEEQGRIRELQDARRSIDEEIKNIPNYFLETVFYENIQMNKEEIQTVKFNIERAERDIGK